MIKKSFIKIICLLIIIGLNWAGFSAIGTTLAYFFDNENSNATYQTGTLDFSLSPNGDFSPLVTPGQPSTRTISVINNGSLGFQYKIQATGFSGELCDYLNLEANVDEEEPEYTGLLKNLSATTTFSEPDDWVFTITLPQNNSIDVLEEESCQFKFVFNAWQENLSEGQGFSDTEEILNNVTAGKWVPNPLTPRDGAVINGTFVKQCWTPISGATKYIYQSCNNNPNIGPCNQRWYAEYPEGTPQFAEACKWASNVGNSTYWWHVKAVIGSYTTSYSYARKIVIDNSHSNQVVINEFLPNPVGPDNAPMPNGEWVELYNNKGGDVDVAGWWLYDVYDDHELAITTGNTNTGGTLIRSGGFLVVYRNGDPDFALNNVGGDKVRLYDDEISSGNLIDSYTYTINALEGKSFARIPDGSNNWVDPLPTPGEPNVLDSEDVIFGPALPEPGEEIPEELPVEEEVVEEVATEEVSIPEEASAIEEELVEELVEEPISEELFNETDEEIIISGTDIPPIETTTPEEEGIITQEEPAIEETPIIEGTDAEEVSAAEENPTVEEIPVIEGESIEEEVTTEENQEQGGIIEEINEIIDEVIEEIVDEIMPDETINEPAEETTDEVVVTEAAVETAEQTVSEPEAPVIEEVPAEAPAVDEQPAAVPDDSSSTPDGAGESISDGGSGDGGSDGSSDAGGSSDSGSSTEGSGESSGDSGNSGDTISE